MMKKFHQTILHNTLQLEPFLTHTNKNTLQYTSYINSVPSRLAIDEKSRLINQRNNRNHSDSQRRLLSSFRLRQAAAKNSSGRQAIKLLKIGRAKTGRRSQFTSHQNPRDRSCEVLRNEVRNFLPSPAKQGKGRKYVGADISLVFITKRVCIKTEYYE